MNFAIFIMPPFLFFFLETMLSKLLYTLPHISSLTYTLTPIAASYHTKYKLEHMKPKQRLNRN